ncbi:MAG: alpha/beta hydrolase [Thermomicrobiales bacterium]
MSSPSNRLNISDAFTSNRRAILATGAGLGLAGALGSNVLAQDATPGASPEAGGVAVDPQMQEVLDALASFQAPPIEDVTPDIARNLPSVANAVAQIVAEKGLPSQEAVGSIEHVLIPAPEGHEIVARVYTPATASTEPMPVLVYFHGGGFVIANLDTYDSSCRALSNAAGAIVASIAYRQAPEFPFPAAVDDAYTATQFFISGAGGFGGDPEKVVVVGESAGGNLATVVSLRARDAGATMPAHQVLIYPLVTFAPAGEAAASVEQFADAKPLNAPMLEWFGSYYSPDMAAVDSPDGSPLDVADLAGLPPATVILAEIDPLLSQGQLYADALEAAGVTVTSSVYTGVTHEFFGTGAVVDKAVEAVTEVADAITAAFA